MPAHIRSVLTQDQPSRSGQQRSALLGTWQGIYLWEHRAAAHERDVIVTVQRA